MPSNFRMQPAARRARRGRYGAFCGHRQGRGAETRRTVRPVVPSYRLALKASGHLERSRHLTGSSATEP